MRYAIVSDIHANLEALDRALEDAARCGAEAVICLGDIVGYGPLPAETLARVRETSLAVIAGNHDDAVSGRGDSSSFIDLAGEAVARHREALTPEALVYLRSLPYAVTIEGALCVHGDAVDPPRFYYVENEEDAAANFEANDAPLIFTGHTHIPAIFFTGDSGTIYRAPIQDFTLEGTKRYLINPGSIGYPREANGSCRSTYVLYDSVARTILFRELPFSVSSVMQRGSTPRRIRKTVLLAAILSTMLLAALLTRIFHRPERITETITETIEVDRAAQLVIETKTIELTRSARSLRLNLALAKGSAPVQVAATFRDVGGKRLDTQLSIIKTISHKTCSVPKGAAKVEFTLSRLEPAADVRLNSFMPEIIDVKEQRAQN